MTLTFGQHPDRAMPLFAWPTRSRVGGTAVAPPGPTPEPERAGFGAMLATPFLFGPHRPRLATDDEDEELIAIMALIAARR